MRRLPADIIVLAAALAFAGAAFARSSDRNQPLDVEASRSDCSVDANGPCSFDGDVHIQQGTLDIRAGHAEVRRAAGDIRHVTLTGSPVRMSQQMDDGKPLAARAARIEYDMQQDPIVLTGGAEVEQPGQSSIRSERIVYNMRTGQVQGGGGTSGGRVKLRLMPKSAPRPAGT